MSYTFRDGDGAKTYAEADGAGTSGDPLVPRVGHRSLVTDFTSASVNNDAFTLDGINFADFHSLKLGSTNGSIYGTSSTILIPLLDDSYQNVAVAVRTSASFDQNLTVTAYAAFSSFFHAQLASFVQSSGATNRFVVSSAGAVGQGGQAGGATVTSNAFYSVPAIVGVPVLRLDFTGAGTPTTGQIAEIIIARW